MTADKSSMRCGMRVPTQELLLQSHRRVYTSSAPAVGWEGGSDSVTLIGRACLSPTYTAAPPMILPRCAIRHTRSGPTMSIARHRQSLACTQVQSQQGALLTASAVTLLENTTVCKGCGDSANAVSTPRADPHPHCTPSLPRTSTVSKPSSVSIGFGAKIEPREPWPS